jgi:tetratricopeptide (TPR) repeat protein
MRALQHYGRTRLAESGQRRYDLLFPLLDLTTTLDPRFNVAYRFGAIFLTEPPPGGPGRPDLAIALLEKGLEAQPRRWEYAQDIGFVHYRSGDYLTAADWFGRAADTPDSPNWLRPLEAVTRTKGGSREASRQLWNQIIAQAGPEEDWLRDQAALRLRQLDALDQIDAIQRVVRAYEEQRGHVPRSWDVLIRAGGLPSIPVDPSGHPYQLNPWSGDVTLAPESSLNPLPTLESPLP